MCRSGVAGSTVGSRWEEGERSSMRFLNHLLCRPLRDLWTEDPPELQARGGASRWRPTIRSAHWLQHPTPSCAGALLPFSCFVLAQHADMTCSLHQMQACVPESPALYHCLETKACFVLCSPAMNSSRCVPHAGSLTLAPSRWLSHAGCLMLCLLSRKVQQLQCMQSSCLSVVQ